LAPLHPASKVSNPILSPCIAGPIPKSVPLLKDTGGFGVTQKAIPSPFKPHGPLPSYILKSNSTLQPVHWAKFIGVEKYTAPIELALFCVSTISLGKKSGSPGVSPGNASPTIVQ